MNILKDTKKLYGCYKRKKIKDNNNVVKNMPENRLLNISIIYYQTHDIFCNVSWKFKKNSQGRIRIASTKNPRI